MSSSATDYASTITLLPTVEFLEYVNAQQMKDLEIGFGTAIPRFYSSTNSEWICLNSVSEFANLPTYPIKNSTTKTELTSDALFLFSSTAKTTKTLGQSKSVFLCRNTEGEKDILLISNLGKSYCMQ